MKLARRLQQSCSLYSLISEPLTKRLSPHMCSIYQPFLDISLHRNTFKKHDRREIMNFEDPPYDARILPCSTIFIFVEASFNLANLT